jgi:hypothetical protein
MPGGWRGGRSVYYDQRQYTFYVYGAIDPEETANRIAEMERMKGHRVPV